MSANPWEKAIKDIYPGAFHEILPNGFHIVTIGIGHKDGLYRGPSCFSENAAWLHAYNELFPDNQFVRAIPAEYED